MNWPPPFLDPKVPQNFLKSVSHWVNRNVPRYRPQIGRGVEGFLVSIGKLVTAPFITPLYVLAPERRLRIPELASDLTFATIFVVGAVGAFDITLEMGKKVICERDCKMCNGWRAMRCTMCKGTGGVHYRVKNFNYKSGEKATVESVAEAITEKRAELVHLPSVIDTSFPLPYKACPSCDGTGVMDCLECRNHAFPIRLSADDIMEPPWKAYNVLKKKEYPYENIVDSMRDPKIAAFWLITMPQLVGRFNYDEEAKQKIWWTYNDSMKYDQLRNLVAKREPGWETLQKALISLDPARAREDPVIVRNVPYYKAKKAVEAEVMKLDVPPRPCDWGLQELNLPLSGTSWTKEELKDPKKFLEMNTLLDAQREMAEKILNAQWEANWRQQKLNELLEEKLQPYVKDSVLPKPFIIQPQPQPRPQPQTTKKMTRRRWWFF